MKGVILSYWLLLITIPFLAYILFLIFKKIKIKYDRKVLPKFFSFFYFLLGSIFILKMYFLKESIWSFYLALGFIILGISWSFFGKRKFK